MKGVFWNCNGFADPKKHRFVSDIVREKDLIHFLALSETGKRDCSQFFLKNLVGGKDFLWHCKPPHGRSGGMLLGVNISFFYIGEIEEGDFFIKFKLRNKQDGFQWFLVSAVYGATQQEFKEVFLTELVHFCSKETLPMLIGGDFNIIRGPHEKNNGN